MAFQVAPEQGWGIYWNAAHPDAPFTPVQVNLGQFAAASGQASVAPTMAVPSVVSDTHVPVGTQADSAASSAASATTSDSQSLGPLTLDQMHFSEQGWAVVPSVANETGQGLATGDGAGGFDVAGDLSSDWFIA